jgi:hypothetical protein
LLPGVGPARAMQTSSLLKRLHPNSPALEQWSCTHGVEHCAVYATLYVYCYRTYTMANAPTPSVCVCGRSLRLALLIVVQREGVRVDGGGRERLRLV